MQKILLKSALVALAITSLQCSQPQRSETTSFVAPDTKIVSLSGSITETLFMLGLGSQVVGTDVTSNFPAAANALPKVGHNRNISAEGVLSLGPQLVIGFSEEMEATLKNQLESAGIEVLLLDREQPSVASTKAIISQLADTMQLADRAKPILVNIEEGLSTIKPFTQKPRVMFIYARGAGTLNVAGNETALQTMIELAGAENAVKGFSGFKPLTAEAVVQADPHVILMFDSGLGSLEGMNGLIAVPGIPQTQAGQNRAIIAMDGQLLSGFGPRLGEAVSTLNQKLHEVYKPESEPAL